MTLISTLAIAFTILVLPTYAQINTPCTASMLTSLTPCLNFLTNSTSNGTSSSPTSGCCDSLKSLTGASMDCLCLVVTGNVPFQVPINRTLAISLPRACNMPGVPLQCKASVAPVPAPGPASFRPNLAPSPIASSIPALAPASETPQDSTPTSPTVDAISPSTNTETHPVLTPSAANPPFNTSPFLMVFVSAILIANYH